MPSLLRDLAGQVHPRHVYSRPADLAAYAFDASGASGARRVPLAVVFPATTAEVAGVVAVCAHHGVPVIARGAGTGRNGGSMGEGVIVCLTRMDHMLGLDAGAGLISVEAGAVMAAVQREAAAAGLDLAIDPTTASTSTVGGSIAGDAAGPRSLRHGGIRNAVVSVTAVLADGSVAHYGAGDEMLAALIGAEGTLGIITEAVLRLTPAPEARTVIAAGFADVARCADAAAAVEKAAVEPAAAEYLDRAALQALAASGHAAGDTNTGALLIIELEGDAGRVRADAETTRNALARSGATRIVEATEPGAGELLLRPRILIEAAVASVVTGKVSTQMVVPRAALNGVVAAATEIATRHELIAVTFGSAAGGAVQIDVLMDPRHSGDRGRAEAAMAEIVTAARAAGCAMGGFAAGGMDLDALRSRWGAAGLDTRRRLQAQADPRGLLNPSKRIPEPAAEGEPVRA